MSLVNLDLEDRLISPVKQTISKSPLISDTHRLHSVRRAEGTWRSGIKMIVLLLSLGLSTFNADHGLAKDQSEVALNQSEKATKRAESQPTYKLTGPTFENGEHEAHPGKFQARFKINHVLNPLPKDQKTPRYTIVKLDDPPRVVVDVINAVIDDVNAPLEPLRGPVTQMSAIQIKGRTHTIGRLLFTLNQPYEHRVKVDQGQLIFELQLKGQSRSQLAEVQESRKSISGEEVGTSQPSELSLTDPHRIKETHIEVPEQATWRVTRIELTSRDADLTPSGEDETHLRLHLAPEDADVKLPVPYLNDDQSLSPYLVLHGVRVPERLERSCSRNTCP